MPVRQREKIQTLLWALSRRRIFPVSGMSLQPFTLCTPRSVTISKPFLQLLASDFVGADETFHPVSA